VSCGVAPGARRSSQDSLLLHHFPQPHSQLISSGADVHLVCPSLEGNSALHEAVARRQDSVIEVLLRAGASPFVENARGACMRAHVWVCACMLGVALGCACWW
jgi:Ankyrin repeat